MNNEKKYRNIIEQEKLEISSRKLEILREHFIQRWAKKKGHKQYGPNRSRRYQEKVAIAHRRTIQKIS